MPKIKRELVIDGSGCRVNESCMECAYFNSEVDDEKRFRCASMGSCPGVTYSSKYKEWLKKRYMDGHGHFVNTELVTEDDIASEFASQIAKAIDDDIIEKLKRDNL